MLQPKRVKYRRPHIIKYEGHCKSAPKVAFGEFGLQALEGTWVTTRQIEAARIVLARYTKSGGQIWIRIFPHLAKTKKPAEVRMGNGKGTVEGWFAVVEKGQILFEVSGVDEAIAHEALHQAGYKLSVTTRVVKKEEVK